MSEIKDSGDRTQFESGAVRDMHEGKGRMDLLPCTAILELAKHCENGAKKYGERNVDKGIPQHSFIDSGLRHIFKYLRGDRDENHLVAALWNVAWAVEQECTKPHLQDLPSRKAEQIADSNKMVVTNADRIRSMSDEELAEFIPIGFDCVCNPNYECIETVIDHGECGKQKECLMNWLKEKVD